MTDVTTTEIRMKGIDSVKAVMITASPSAEVDFAYIDYDQEEEHIEKAEWLSLSEPVLARGWDNPNDAQYDDL